MTADTIRQLTRRADRRLRFQLATREILTAELHVTDDDEVVIRDQGSVLKVVDPAKIMWISGY
jgi:hypothetical protein